MRHLHCQYISVRVSVEGESNNETIEASHFLVTFLCLLRVLALSEKAGDFLVQNKDFDSPNETHRVSCAAPPFSLSRPAPQKYLKNIGPTLTFKMVSKKTLVLLVSALAPPAFAANYTLTKDYSNSFFDQFDFFTGPDPTSGFVSFVDEQTANSTGLAGFVSTSTVPDAAYMGVDAVNVTPNGRPAVRIASKDTWNHMLMVADIQHMPIGCGTWPAFWMLGGPNAWPENGEIDVIEGVNSGVNDMTPNTMTLHTDAGISLANTTADMTGNITTTNCDVAASSNNLGCQIHDPDSISSFGVPFNKIGGGVYATEYTSEAIKIWFFARGSIPADISAGMPNPDVWPAPNALFESDADSLDSHFSGLQVIFDTTLCGDWAGNAAVWEASECSVLADTCVDYVTSNPSAFTEAYCAINDLKVYQDQSQGLASKAKRSYSRRRRGASLPM